MTGKMLTPEQVAERLAVTPNTVRGWLRKGMLKGVKLGKKVWRVREEDLEAYICCEQTVEYGVMVVEEELGEDDLKAIKSGIEDIKAGSMASKEDYKKGKRPLTEFAGSLAKRKDFPGLEEEELAARQLVAERAVEDYE